MVKVDLQIDPVFLGPLSVGTVSVIKLIREHFGLGLADAKGIVDRAVEGEIVSIPAQSREIASRFVDAVSQFPPRPSIRAVIAEESRA